MANSATKATTTSNGCEPLLGALRRLKAQGDTGFEGYVRDLLETLAGQTLRLMKSGPQGGKDVLSDTEYGALGLAIEAKRFGDNTDLSLDMQKSKLRDALSETPSIDVWGIAASTEIKEPDWSELKQIAGEKGVTLLCLDWRNAPGALPALAALCASGRQLTKQRLQSDLDAILDNIENHPEFQNTLQRIRRTLSSPEVGFDLARAAH